MDSRRRGATRHVGLAHLVGWTLGLVPAEVVAQVTGVLTGTVSDGATQERLPKVTVTATSPNLPGEQVATTDASGTYRIAQLPPGMYQLHFERDGYEPFIREGIELPAAFTLRFNALLLPLTMVGETIIVASRPVIDIASSQQTTVRDQAFITTIPVLPPGGRGGNNRSFEGLAATVPTARVDLYGVSINGATSPENSYMIDGLFTRNPGFGINGSLLSIEFVDSVNVTTGGYLPEYGRSTGGVIAANTKSGGNDFHGSIWGTWTPGALAGAPHPVTDLNSVLTLRNEVHNIVDFGATLGGYIVRDKLWFFVGFQPEFTRYRVNRDLTPFGTGPNGETLAEPAIHTDSAFADEHQLQYFGKLTYLVTEEHRISLSVTGTSSQSGGDNAYAFFFRQPGSPRVTPDTIAAAPSAKFSTALNSSFDAVLKLNSAFNERHFLLDVTAGWHHEDHDSKPSDGSKIGSTDPDALVNQPFMTWAPRSLTEFEDLPASVVADCLSDGNGGRSRCRVSYVTGGPARLDNEQFDSLQLSVVLSVLFQGWGHHILKLGLATDVSEFDHTYAYAGGARLAELGADSPIRTERIAYLVAPDEAISLAFRHARTRSVLVGGFIQDSWSIADRVTMNVGFRYDSQTLSDPNGRTALSFPSEWSPRVGLVWDFTQQGRSKVYASYARYFENVPLDIADQTFGSAVLLRGRFPAASGDCAPRSRNTSSCQAGSPTQVSDPPNPSWLVRGPNEPAPVDPSLRPPSEDEWVAGIEYELFPSTRVSLAYNHRQIVQWVEDMSANANATLFFIGNPGEGIGSGLPAPRRVYDSITFAVNKVFSHRWLAQLSYTWQQLNGNIEGLFRTKTGQLDPNINVDFDVPPSNAVNLNGRLPGDVRHTVKAYVSKEFVLAPAFTLVTGIGYTGSSGTPIDFLAESSLTGYEVFVFPRGSGGTLPWIHAVDLGVALSFGLSTTTALSVSVNVFNLLNSQQVTSVADGYTLSVFQTGVGVVPIPGGNPGTDRGKLVDDVNHAPLDPKVINPNFWRPATYQPVRQVRFQARLVF